ncbi:hypothetical protein [Phenylobacterium sp.]|uniref:hypothetical protein n=1 Tax=Phenylobacterium sp. TaxID=1871053 RepID=UPI002DEB3D79|nr:hypothetical protein [Phenylobacterium sp.]
MRQRHLAAAVAAVVLLGIHAPPVAAAGYPKDDGPLRQCDAGEARPSTPQAPPSADKIIAIPNIADIYDGRRCDISGMSIAVRDNGQVRDIYRLKGRRLIPDARLSPPTITAAQQAAIRTAAVENLKRRVETKARELIAEAAGARPGASREDLEAALRKTPVKVLIYAHGGLVSQEKAVFGAEGLAPVMIRDGYVPLFLIWNSDFLVSYGDRLCCVRRGSVDPNSGFNQWISIPTRLISDIGSSIATAPENYLQQVIRYKESVLDKDFDLYYLNYEDVLQDCGYFDAGHHRGHVCSNIVFPEFRPIVQARPGNYEKALLNGGFNNRRAKETFLYSIFFLPRVAATATVSQVGAQAWDNMVRRTRIAFDNESTPVNPADPNNGEKSCHDGSDLQRIDEPLTCPHGGFTLFFNDLTPYLAHVDDDDPTLAMITVKVDGLGEVQVPVTIEYYGHSMGAIVGDELISRYPGFPWSKIVYMAAADTVRDFKRMITLAIDSDPSRTRLAFYSLSLHPLNESREREGYGALPQGSLLEWIDEMFNLPKSGDDRTLGKWKNVEATLPTWRDGLLERMTFRVFPAQNNLKNSSPEEQRMFNAECDPTSAAGEDPPVICHPLKHGDFNSFSFWRQVYLTDKPAAPAP